MKHIGSVSKLRVAYAQEDWVYTAKSIMGPATIASGLSWLICQLVKEM